MSDIDLEQLVLYLKEYGFIYQGSEIYGGLSNTWDLGPQGALLYNNIKNLWLQKFLHESESNVLLDSQILMNKEVFVATGHVKNFSDPLIDCKCCHSRFRADHLIEKNLNINVDGFSNQELEKIILENKLICPKCNKSNFTQIRNFNLMFKTNQGVIEDSSSLVYLRPETAQGIFVNFKNILRTQRRKLPFGVCQIGKCFRNEITPGNFIFRTREFEQMELEFFVKPGTELSWFSYWQEKCLCFLTNDLAISRENLRLREHKKEELSFYSNKTTDIEYNFPFGFGEVWGIASRTDYDLSVHMSHSGCDLTYLDPETNTKYIPYVVEPSVGVNRLMLVCLFDSFKKEDDRIYLKLSKNIVPYQICVMPLIKKDHGNLSKELFLKLSRHFRTTYEDNQNIGKRYKRQDCIGTYLCISVCNKSIENNIYTIRFRDTKEQVEVASNNLIEYLNKVLYD